MKPGEITEPINYQGRYFILRRGEDVPKSFEDAKKELEVSLRNRKAYSVAAELAGKIADELKQNKDIQKTASDFAAQANMSPTDMIRETGYVKPGDNVDKIGVSQQFEEGIANLENPQDVGDKTPVPDGFAVPMLEDKKPPRDAEFAEVKDQIVEVVKLDKARAQVRTSQTRSRPERQSRRPCRAGNGKGPKGTGPEIIHSGFAAWSGAIGINQPGLGGCDLCIEGRRCDKNTYQNG
jgi:hypothetical protein